MELKVATKHKHYDKDGRYTGETIVKSQEEIEGEAKAAGALLGLIAVVAAIAFAIHLLFTFIAWIVGLISNPSDLGVPHNLFAYLYSYLFQGIIVVYEVAFVVIKFFVYDIPFEHFIYIKSITKFANFNFILWVLMLAIWYVFAIALPLMHLYEKIYQPNREAIVDWGIVILVILIFPSIIWVVYSLLEIMFKWIFA